MYQKRETAPGETRHRLAQLLLGDPREVIDTGVNEEGLDTCHSCFQQRLERLGVAGNEPSPETTVDPDSTRGRAHLYLQRLDRGGDRNAVEWHVDQRGDAACRRRARR